KTWAAIEIGFLPARVVPRPGGSRELPERAERLAILREPAAEPRPLADQRLVRDLDGLIADDDEAGGRPTLEHRRRLPVGEQLRTRHSPARVLGRLAEVGEPKEHASHERLLSIAAAEEDLLRGVGDRAAYAAGIAVARDGQHATNSARPRLVERMRE